MFAFIAGPSTALHAHSASRYSHVVLIFLLRTSSRFKRTELFLRADIPTLTCGFGYAFLSSGAGSNCTFVVHAWVGAHIWLLCTFLEENTYNIQMSMNFFAPCVVLQSPLFQKSIYSGAGMSSKLRRSCVMLYKFLPFVCTCLDPCARTLAFQCV